MPDQHIRFDWAIKRLLRQKANFGILEGFLSELIKQDVKIEEILESEGNKEDALDKYNRVDILAKLDGGEMVIIEVQNEREHDYFHRMNYAQAKLISQFMHESAKYRDVKRIISVNIVYFKLGQGLDYLYEGSTQFRGVHKQDILELNSSQRKMFPSIETVSDIFARYYIIKVNTFDDNAIDPIDEWIYFLKNSEIKDSFSAKGIQEASEKMRKDKLHGHEREAYDLFVKDQRIKDAEIESVLVDAQIKHEEIQQKILAREADALAREAEALALAEKERAEKESALAEKENERAEKLKSRSALAQTARILLSMGVSKDDIARNIGLSASQLEDLLL